jgi:hypothetical protein
MSELVQNSLVGLIVLWSVWATLSRLAPSLLQVPQQRLARWLNNQGWTTAGQYISSPQKNSGCDSGCGSCASACSNSVEQVVKFVNK